MSWWLTNESYPPHFDILVLCNETILHICSMLIQRGGRNSNIKQKKLQYFKAQSGWLKHGNTKHIPPRHCVTYHWTLHETIAFYSYFQNLKTY